MQICPGMPFFPQSSSALLNRTHVISPERLGRGNVLTPILLNHTIHRHKDMYQRGARYLSLEPHEVGLVAAHSVDLRAAASAGLKVCIIVFDCRTLPVLGHPERSSIAVLYIQY
jgi:hypothetical protein